uniref:Beta-amyrin 11-oxidase-like n=1 Tax=Cucumis melo TaxID=3656 RepID=A0A9I9CGS2_CUCME
MQVWSFTSYSRMEMISVCVTIGVVLGVSLLVFRRLNELWYLVKLGGKAYKSLPPGDLGWPVIGSSFSSYKTFMVQEDPISFIQSLHSRYGEGGIYKTHLYGKPIVIATDSEICRRIYLDEAKFKQHNPESVKILEGSSGDFSKMDHKIAYKVVATPMNGSEVLSNYVDFIEEVIAKGLEEWSSMLREPIKLLDEIGSLFFKVITKVFLGSRLDAKTMVELHALYKELSFAMVMSTFPYDFPGFTFHQALKARKKIENIIQGVVEEKRRRFENDKTSEVQCQVDKMVVAIDENGAKLYNNNLIRDLLLGVLFAGHSTPAIAAFWALLHISQNPHVFQKAKEEQESIIRQRPSNQKGLTLNEIKQMKYLTKVINEVLRRNTITPTNFREAKTDVNINGYFIPKGWTIQIWNIAVHMDPQIHSNPQEFNPSRWENYTPKPGTFIPFGLGSRFCPGSELARLEITILLHHFILNYKYFKQKKKKKHIYIYLLLFYHLIL